MSITFEVTGTRLTSGSPHDRLDVLSSAEGTLEVSIDGRLLYREIAFPFVELGVALRSWLLGAFRANDDFEFQSMDSDAAGLVWFRRVSGGWRIGSIHQEFPELRTISSTEVEDAVQHYNEFVDNWLKAHTRLGIADL